MRHSELLLAELPARGCREGTGCAATAGEEVTGPSPLTAPRRSVMASHNAALVSVPLLAGTLDDASFLLTWS
jgi:hypothetical protein